MSKERNDKESMICLTPKPSQKNFRVSLWLPSSPNLNPLDCAQRGVLENKTNATSQPNISLFKNAIEEDRNEMSREFILKTCKLF